MQVDSDNESDSQGRRSPSVEEHDSESESPAAPEPPRKKAVDKVQNWDAARIETKRGPSACIVDPQFDKLTAFPSS
jgi:hypothetical protein